MLPACDLQAVLPECSQLPENVCETHELLQLLPGEHLRSQVWPGRCDVRGSGSRLCPGLCTGCDMCGSVCAQVRSGSDMRCSLCSGLCSGSGELRCSLCTRSRKLRCSLRSRCQVLRDEVLQRGSLRSGSLDL